MISTPTSSGSKNDSSKLLRTQARVPEANKMWISRQFIWKSYLHMKLHLMLAKVLDPARHQKSHKAVERLTPVPNPWSRLHVTRRFSRKVLPMSWRRGCDGPPNLSGVYFNMPFYHIFELASFLILISCTLCPHQLAISDTKAVITHLEMETGRLDMLAKVDSQQTIIELSRHSEIPRSSRNSSSIKFLINCNRQVLNGVGAHWPITCGIIGVSQRPGLSDFPVRKKQLLGKTNNLPQLQPPSAFPPPHKTFGHHSIDLCHNGSLRLFL